MGCAHGHSIYHCRYYGQKKTRDSVKLKIFVSHPRGLGAAQQPSRLWRREEKVTGLGWENSALSVHPIRRKLRPVKQWCDSNPNLSMVPLSGGEDIGEADKGFVVDSLSRLEECIQRGSRAVRIGHEPANAFVHSHDLPKDQIHQVQNDPTGGKDAGH